jgi:hypothetical protein
MKIDISGETLRLLDHFIHFASAHPERFADAMWYDLDGFTRRVRCLGKALHEAKDEMKRKKTKCNKKEQPPLPDNFDCRFPEPIGGKIREWMTYKTERKDFYNTTGLHNLLAQIDKQAKNHSPELVVDLISECMANNWAGIIWDRMNRLEARTNGRYDKRSVSRMASSGDSLWTGFLSGKQDG